MFIIIFILSPNVHKTAKLITAIIRCLLSYSSLYVLIKYLISAIIPIIKAIMPNADAIRKAISHHAVKLDVIHNI